MGNIYVRTYPVGNIKSDKAKSIEKIDGAVNMIMTSDICIRNKGNSGDDYDEREVTITYFKKYIA